MRYPLTQKRYNRAQLVAKMNMGQPPTSTDPGSYSFAAMVQRLGQTFMVRDVMVKLDQIRYIAPGDAVGAMRIVEVGRFSAVPGSRDGQTFETVFCTEPPPGSTTPITERPTTVADYIPDSTPLAEAFGLFEDREWYLALRANQVSGLITYWDFNSHEFRVQLYVVLSRVEELSRNVLAKDGCGVSDPTGLSLSPKALKKLSNRFESAKRKLGGNRFVDELDFYHANNALKGHGPWREHLRQQLGENLSNSEYDRRYNFTSLRDAVMHGRLIAISRTRLEPSTGLRN